VPAAVEVAPADLDLVLHDQASACTGPPPGASAPRHFVTPRRGPPRPWNAALAPSVLRRLQRQPQAPRAPRAPREPQAPRAPRAPRAPPASSPARIMSAPSRAARRRVFLTTARRVTVSRACARRPSLARNGLRRPPTPTAGSGWQCAGLECGHSPNPHPQRTPQSPLRSIGIADCPSRQARRPNAHLRMQPEASAITDVSMRNVTASPSPRRLPHLPPTEHDPGFNDLRMWAPARSRVSGAQISR